MVFFDGLSRALGNRQHKAEHKAASAAKVATYKRSPALVDNRPKSEREKRKDIARAKLKNNKP